MRPATRIGRWVCFKDGRQGRLKLRAYLLVKLGLKKTVLYRDFV